jgi:hypothetical protein
MPRQANISEGNAPFNHPLLPYIPQHSTSYDFTRFASIGEGFVTAVAKVFALRAGGISKVTSKSDYHALGLLFRWIQSNQLIPEFRRKLFRDHKSILVDEWEMVLNMWRDDFVNGKRSQSETAGAQVIRIVNVLLEALVASRVLRPISRLAPVKNSNKKMRPKKCLAEVQQLYSPKSATRQAGGDLSQPFFPDDLSSLASGTNAARGTADYIQAVAHLNKTRLEALRRCAEQELKGWREHFKEGQRILDLCDMSFPDIRKILHKHYRNNVSRGWALRRLFPKSLPDLALSRYLTYVLHEHGGIIPLGKKTRPLTFHISFCRSRGGIEKVRAYLIPNSAAANAARLIFLLDTGSNCAVGLSLDRGCLSDSDVPGHKSIAGFKDRARGKLIVSDLPVRDPLHEISCVEALEIYEEMSQRLVERAPARRKNKLFLYVHKKGKVDVMGYSSADKQLKALLSRHQEFQGLNLTAEMIRPTRLFQAMYQNDGSLIDANVLADHASFSTTSIYANKPSLRIVYERLIREFQSLFQVVSISDIEGAAQKLRMNNSQFRSLLKKAHRTGLGVACFDPKSGYQPGSIKGEDCSQYY